MNRLSLNKTINYISVSNQDFDTGPLGTLRPIPQYSYIGSCIPRYYVLYTQISKSIDICRYLPIDQIYLQVYKYTLDTCPSGASRPTILFIYQVFYTEITISTSSVLVNQTSNSCCLELDSKQPRYFKFFSSQGNYLQLDQIDQCLT